MIPKSFNWSRALSSISFLDSRPYSFVTYYCGLRGGRKSGWYQCDVEDFKRLFANRVFRHNVDYINLTLTVDDSDISKDEVWLYYFGWWYHLVID